LQQEHQARVQHQHALLTYESNQALEHHYHQHRKSELLYDQAWTNYERARVQYRCKRCPYAAYPTNNKLHNHLREHHNKPPAPAADRSICTNHCTNLSNNLTLPVSKAVPTTSYDTHTPNFSGYLSAPSTGPSTKPPTYRALSPGPPAYQNKPYLTMRDLFMRYQPINKLAAPRAPIVLPTMSLTDLYRRFHKLPVKGSFRSSIKRFIYQRTPHQRAPPSARPTTKSSSYQLGPQSAPQRAPRRRAPRRRAPTSKALRPTSSTVRPHCNVRCY